jgi:hypothetical protein
MPTSSHKNKVNSLGLLAIERSQTKGIFKTLNEQTKFWRPWSNTTFCV